MRNRKTIRSFCLCLALLALTFLSCGPSDGAFGEAAVDRPDDSNGIPAGSSPGGGDDSARDDDDAADDDDSVPDDDDPLDPEGDEDRDGVSNGQEARDGTDPFDPSDALAWHPEYAGHPKLIADRERWLQIKSNILFGVPDAQRLFARVQALADLTPREQEPGNFLFGHLEHNGAIALNAALVAFVTENPAYSDKAIQITSELEVRLREIPFSEVDHGTIHGGQALVEFCLAYDLLVGFGLADVDQANAMRDAILNVARKLYNFYIVVPIGKLLQNNHLIKFVAGLCVTGMTFNDIPEAAVYINLAMTTAPYVLLEFQMPEEGGQGEGPNYLDYTFKTYLFYAAIYHQFAKGESYPYRIDCRARLSPACTPDVLEVADPVVDERMERLLDWRLAIVLPDGRCPPIDDSNVSCGYSGPVAALYERADYAWHYRASRDCAENTSSLAAVELAYLHRMPEPSLPEFGPSVFLYDGGQAVLRSEWGPDAVYALVNGEHGRARLSGLGHEQPDATSFIFWAFGDMFALDSGYISYDERWHVIHARNHNLILVDDLGPSLGLYWAFVGVDSYLSEFIDEPPFRSVTVRASYQGADIERRVMMIGDDYFITSERVTSDRPRQYTWLLQANAGGSTDGIFTLEPTGGLIERPNGTMRTFLQSDAGPIEFLEGVEEHGFQHGRMDTHAVLRGEVQARTATFLGVHVVAGLKRNLPEVESLSVPGLLGYFVRSGEFMDVVVANNGPDFYLPGGAAGEPAIESDASFVWIRTDPSDLTLAASQRIDGTYLSIDGIIQE